MSMKYLKKLVFLTGFSDCVTPGFFVFFLWSGLVTAKPHEYEVSVDGIACPFCLYGIEKQLDKMGGILEMESDVASGVIRLRVDESVTVTEAKVRDAVEKAGFSLRAFQVVTPNE